MIILDTETTGFAKPITVPLDQQPEIVELAMLQLDDATLAPRAELSFLIRPRVLPLGPETIKATGITTDMVKDQLPFARRVTELVNFVLGERIIAAHNCGYDMLMLWFELKRLGLDAKFPWPPQQVCTVELTMDLEAPRQKSDRLKLSELYEYAFGEPPPAKHRAMDDVRSLARIVGWLREKDGRI